MVHRWCGEGKQVDLGVLLELLLVIANVGTAVVLFPIARRQNEILALGQRLLLAAAAAGAVVAAIAALLVLRGGSTTLDRVEPNSVGIVDPGSGDIVGQVRVGRTPSDIAFGEGALWVANLESGTVSEIDPDSREVVATFTPERR